jgi:CheY-like chemotaxis protein
VAGLGKTVLLVDDEHAIVEALGELLAFEGYAVRTAPDGPAAIELVRAGGIDVVLLDVMMPGMDGLQVLAAMRADPGIDGVPVVLMSAAPIPRETQGSAGTLQKPFDLETLRATLARVLSRPSGG